MKKKPTKLEAKVASLEKKLSALLSFNIQQNLVEMQRRIAFVENDLKGPNKLKEPEMFEDCLMLFREAWQGSSSKGGIFKIDEDDAWENGVRTTGSYQMVSFRTEALARKAIKILGEETIKTAYGL